MAALFHRLASDRVGSTPRLLHRNDGIDELRKLAQLSVRAQVPSSIALLSSLNEWDVAWNRCYTRFEGIAPQEVRTLVNRLPLVSLPLTCSLWKTGMGSVIANESPSKVAYGRFVVQEVFIVQSRPISVCLFIDLVAFLIEGFR
jgi:hypothetical protein